MENKFIFGFHSINSCINSKFFSIDTIYINNNRKDIRINNILNILKESKISIIKVSKNYLFKISKTYNHQGIVAKIKKNNIILNVNNLLKDITKNSLFLIIDKVTDPHNLGACLRVANCFNVKGVFITKYNSVKLNSTVLKVSSGAFLDTPCIEVTNLINIIKILKKNGFWIIGLDCNNSNINLYNMKFFGSLALIVGSEDKGIRNLIKKNCDFLINIPMLGTIKNLNVSVASGICLYEIRKQQNFLKN